MIKLINKIRVWLVDKIIGNDLEVVCNVKIDKGVLTFTGKRPAICRFELINNIPDCDFDNYVPVTTVDFNN